MLTFFDLRTTAKRFRFIAVLEALTWLGLLIGMAFKWLPADGNEAGVKFFGPVHGAVFVLYLIITIVTAVKLRWDLVTTLIAAAASIPPFGTVVFEMWAVRNGKLGELSALQTDLAKSARAT